MRLLVAKEKHNSRYFIADTNEQLEKASAYLIKERLENGWYGLEDTNDDDSEELAAQKAIDNGRAYSFLMYRCPAEYENVSLEVTEDVE